MKYTIKKILPICALSVFSLSIAAEDALNAADIKSLFSGKTVNAYSEIKKAPVSLYYDENGEVRGKFSNGKIGITKWWVKDNGQICLKGKGGDLCFVVIEENDQYHKYLVKSDGERILAFSMETFSEGNMNQY